MRCFHHNLTFELPDAWIMESGAKSFEPKRYYYLPIVNPEPKQKIKYIEFQDVEPCLERQRRRGIFCDDKNQGFTAKERVVRILEWIVSDTPIEPVQVVPSSNNQFKYKLTEGCHRFYCAIAMKFKTVPTVEGYDVNA